MTSLIHHTRRKSSLLTSTAAMTHSTAAMTRSTAAMTYWYQWQNHHDECACSVTCLVRHTRIAVSLLTPTAVMTHSYVVWFAHVWCDMTHLWPIIIHGYVVWHDSFICVTWLIHMRDMLMHHTRSRSSLLTPTVARKLASLASFSTAHI